MMSDLSYEAFNKEFKDEKDLLNKIENLKILFFLKKEVLNYNINHDLKKIQTNANAMFNINFADPNTITKYSVGDIIKNKIELKDKIVLVGLNAAGLSYLKDTPLGLMTDTTISAQTIETMLTDTQLIRTGITNFIELVGLLSIGIFLILIVPRMGITSTVGVFLTLLTTMILLSATLYHSKDYLLDISFPIVFITIIWAHLVFNSFAKQFRLRQQIKKQFEHYLDPGMVKKLQQDPSLLKLGGETKQMTFLFSDIRGFTPISEKYKGNPEGLTKLINRFLTRMTNVILANGGTIDKFMGDCIMAFWNAPLQVKNHAQVAVRTAIQMQKELKKLHNSINTIIMTGVEAITIISKAWPIFVGFILLIVTLAQAHYRIKVLEEKVKVLFELHNKLVDKK